MFPRCVPNKSGWFIWKLPPWIYSCRAALEQSLDLYLKPKRATDWQTSLSLWRTRSVAGVYIPNWYGPGVLWYRDLRHVTRDLCRTSRRCNPWDCGAVKCCRIFNNITFCICVNYFSGFSSFLSTLLLFYKWIAMTFLISNGFYVLIHALTVLSLDTGFFFFFLVEMVEMYLCFRR